MPYIYYRIPDKNAVEGSHVIEVREWDRGGRHALHVAPNTTPESICTRVTCGTTRYTGHRIPLRNLFDWKESG